jgi:GntR family transcriptional repressor for pyruvate dehydrogenase complex
MIPVVSPVTTTPDMHVPRHPVRFSRVERTPTLADRVAAQLLDAIGAGRFRDGDPLPSERTLGDQFGVSRTVVREAIRELVARDVLEADAGRGVRVIAPKPALSR